jgi:hypothetical protein
MAGGTRMQQRRATAAVWATSDYVLAAGELGVTTDTGIIKIGNGTSPWTELDIAFGSEYLPILGKAADSELLDGIGADSFVKVVDTDTAATANKVAKRLSDGKLKAVAGTASDDLVNFAQMTAADSTVLSSAITSARLNAISRTVTAAFTLQATDIGGTVIANNSSSSYTPFNCTIPTNASVSIPVGSSFKLSTSNKGPVRLVPAGGVTIRGLDIVYGGYSTSELLKIATDEWLVVETVISPGPYFRSYVNTSTTSIPTSSFTAVNYGGTDSGPASTAAVDSLGANEQWSSSFVTRVFCRREGIYDALAHVSFGAATGRCALAFYVNGSAAWGGSLRPGGAIEENIPNVNPLKLQLGDYVETKVYQESGSNKTPGNSFYAASFFEWRWRRPL